MSPKILLPDPGKEVALSFPSIVDMHDDGRASADARPPVIADREEAKRFALESLETLRSQADSGEVGAEAALAVLNLDIDAAADAFAALWSDEVRDEAARKGLFALAAEADAQGRAEDALVILAVLAGTRAGYANGLLGLAVIACRHDRTSEAFDIASACLDLEERHPRAFSIAGICELKRGNRSSAQAYLASSSRLARRRPEYAAELQIAQRALLLMHLQ